MFRSGPGAAGGLLEQKRNGQKQILFIFVPALLLSVPFWSGGRGVSPGTATERKETEPGYLCSRSASFCSALARGPRQVPWNRNGTERNRACLFFLPLCIFLFRSGPGAAAGPLEQKRNGKKQSLFFFVPALPHFVPLWPRGRGRPPLTSHRLWPWGPEPALDRQMPRFLRQCAGAATL